MQLTMLENLRLAASKMMAVAILAGKEIVQPRDDPELVQAMEWAAIGLITDGVPDAEITDMLVETFKAGTNDACVKVSDFLLWRETHGLSTVRPIDPQEYFTWEKGMGAA